MNKYMNIKNSYHNMNCTPKIGHNFWRCSFLCQNTQKKLKKKSSQIAITSWTLTIEYSARRHRNISNPVHSRRDHPGYGSPVVFSEGCYTRSRFEKSAHQSSCQSVFLWGWICELSHCYVLRLPVRKRYRDGQSRPAFLLKSSSSDNIENSDPFSIVIILKVLF